MNYYSIAITVAALAGTLVPSSVDAQLAHRMAKAGTRANMLTQMRTHAPSSHSSLRASKTTASATRLISAVDLEYSGTDFVPVDSFAITYTGANSGAFEDRYLQWNWKFTQALGYMYNSTGTYDPAEIKMLQTFDAASNVTSSTSQFWESTTSLWINESRQNYTYDASNNVLTKIDQNYDIPTFSWENSNRSSYTYTAANKVATDTQDTWNSTTSMWEHSGLTLSTYDAANNIILELTQGWNSSTSTYEDIFRTTFTYDASNNRTSELMEFWDMTTSAWVNSNKTISSGFVSYQPTSVIYQNWDETTSTFENSNKEILTYTADNKPDTYYTQEWNSTTGAWESTTSSYGNRFHYENLTTGLDVIADFGGNATMFPVPAVSVATIDVTWNEAQSFVASITDMQGRVRSTWTVAAKDHYRETISLSDLSSGNYVLTLQGQKGKVTKQFSVIK